MAKIYGQLEYAQLENVLGVTASPAPFGRVFIDSTSTSAGIPRVYDGTAWRKFVLDNTAGDILTNWSLSAAVATSALTITMNAASGLAPAAGNLLYLRFRSATATTGTPITRSFSAALTLTVSLGTSLGVNQSSIAHNLWVYAVDSDGAGTLKLAVSQVKYDEGSLQSCSKESAVVTVTSASPGVVTETGHNRTANEAIRFTTTSALPIGLSGSTTYYVKSPSTNTYTLSTIPGGSAVNTSSTGVGVQTVHAWGSQMASDGYYSSKPVRVLGRMVVSEATAGTWASAPTEVTLASTPISGEVIAAKVYLGSNQTISNNTETVITFDTIIKDTHSCYDSSNHAWICPKTGWYTIAAAGYLGAVNTTGLRRVQVNKNGVAIFRGQQTPSSSVDYNQSVTASEYLVAGDYLTVISFQTSTGSETLTSGLDITYLSVMSGTGK